MTAIFTELNDDPDTKKEFFEALFDKMHLELKNIKPPTFYEAEKNLEIIKVLLDQEGAA
jgi:hypothetical protein